MKRTATIVITSFDDDLRERENRGIAQVAWKIAFDPPFENAEEERNSIAAIAGLNMIRYGSTGLEVVQ